MLGGLVEDYIRERNRSVKLLGKVDALENHIIVLEKENKVLRDRLQHISSTSRSNKSFALLRDAVWLLTFLDESGHKYVKGINERYKKLMDEWNIEDMTHERKNKEGQGNAE